MDGGRVCDVTIHNVQTAILDSGVIRFLARPFVDLRKFKQSLLDTFRIRFGVGSNDAPPFYASAANAAATDGPSASSSSSSSPEQKEDTAVAVTVAQQQQQLQVQQLLAAPAYESFRRCTDWHVDFALQIPPVSSFLEMIFKRAAKNSQQAKQQQVSE